MGPPAKRRKTETAAEEITFDLAARQEFLTGFHKRKLQRAKFAQDKAEQRARQEKIDERKRLREERKAELVRHVQTVNAMLKPAGLGVEDSSTDDNENDAVEPDDWNGIDDLQPPQVDHEAEYVDEDKFTTVTVEEVDVTRDGLSRPGEEYEAGSNAQEVKALQPGEPPDQTAVKAKTNKQPWKRDRLTEKLKRPKKKRNFRYEGKIERKLNRAKATMKNRKQAQARKAG